MAKAMRAATARAIGGDLRMSGSDAGAARIEPSTSAGEASVEMSGATYALADKGRRRSRPARARRGHALATPWGPRVSVRGSTWAGFDITDRTARKAITAGVKALDGAIGRAIR
jgi:hypothetical protein